MRSSTRIKDWWENIRSDQCGKHDPDKEACIDGLPDEVVGDGEMENRNTMMGLKKLHVNSGHCSVDDTYRMWKLGKARTRALQLCKKFRCAECDRHQAPKISRTVKPKSTTHFGEKLGFDVIEMQLSDGAKICGLNMLMCTLPCR